MALTAKQIDQIARVLEGDRARLLRRLQRFAEEREDVEIASFSQHMAEQASALTERENAFLQASEEGRRLIDVDRALDRIVHERDRFGVCRVCGKDIAFERLEAIPTADLCVECKVSEEGTGDGRSD